MNFTNVELLQGLGSGACCVTALIEGREMVISNLGDCRAVVCRDGSAEALTTDHRPAREDERRRIEDKVDTLVKHDVRNAHFNEAEIDNNSFDQTGWICGESSRNLESSWNACCF